MVLSLPLEAQTLVEYTHYPLSVTHTVPPNILILMDNSKGMHQQAYEGDFDPEVIYDGYFDPSARYSYSDDSYFKRDSAGIWHGNFLNWLTMRRIDILRRVLIGGKAMANSRDGSGSQELVGEGDIESGYEFIKRYERGSSRYYPKPSEFGLASSSPVFFGLDKGFIYVGDSSDPLSYYTRKFAIRVQKESSIEPEAFIEGNVAGLVQQIGSKAHFGLEVFNSDGEGGKITNPIGDSLNNLTAAIENSSITTWSPLAEALFEGIR